MHSLAGHSNKDYSDDSSEVSPSHKSSRRPVSRIICRRAAAWEAATRLLRVTGHSGHTGHTGHPRHDVGPKAVGFVPTNHSR